MTALPVTERLADGSVRAVLWFCRALALVVAWGQSVALRSGLVGLPDFFARRDKNALRTLGEIWFARLVREAVSVLVHTPCRRALLKRVAWQDPSARSSGCVVAICHSPWARLMAAWSEECGFAFALARGRWIVRTGSRNVSGGVADLRRLIRRLRAGACVAVVADVFPTAGGCPVQFLNELLQASSLPARLAAAAGVPVVPAVFVWRRTKLVPLFGASDVVSKDKARREIVTRELLAFFDREIRKEPAIWSNVLKKSRFW